MKMKSVVLLAVAVGCGLVAMLGVQQALSGREKAPRETGDVLVALTDIGPGMPLDESNVTFRQWPKEQIPEGAVVRLEDYDNRALRVRAFAGEIIMLAKLGEPGVFGAASEVPDGMRVVTVSVDLTMIASGMIRPGDRVDVVVTYRARAQDGRNTVMRSQTVLEFMRVFATDNVRDMAGQETGEFAAKNISLLATPEQANLLKLAENMGKLHLTLRSRTDDQPSDLAVIDESALLDGGASMGEDKGLLEEQIALKSREAGADDGRERSIRELLEENADSGEPAAEPVPEVAAADAEAELPVDEVIPEVPTWKITIYSGEDVREEQVEIPESMLLPPAVEAEAAPAVPADGEQTSAEKKRPIWQKMLSTFFTGA